MLLVKKVENKKTLHFSFEDSIQSEVLNLRQVHDSERDGRWEIRIPFLPLVIFPTALLKWRPHQRTCPDTGAQNIPRSSLSCFEAVFDMPCTLLPASAEIEKRTMVSLFLRLDREA